uniref:Uncharacterized protein n=1 Tax=Globodera rostochiensis TaxID=31243 RepID=A0A914IBY3_GLORO
MSEFDLSGPAIFQDVRNYRRFSTRNHSSKVGLFAQSAPTVTSRKRSQSRLIGRTEEIQNCSGAIGETAKNQKAAEEKKHSDSLIQLKFFSFDKFKEKCKGFDEDFKELENESEGIEKKLRRLARLYPDEKP